MKRDGPQIKELQDALISAFPTRQDLERMVFYGLDKRLGDITGEGKLEYTVFELLRWAEAHGRLKELVNAALRHNAQNPQLMRITPLLGLSYNQATSSDIATPPLLRIWNIPYPRNPFFTGQEEVLTQLINILKQGQPTALSQLQVISGLGGIGKTQIAVEYAYQHRQDYQAVLWVLADSRESLVSGYIAVAKLLNLSQKDEQDQAVILKAVKAWLQTHDSWLLILDNANDLALVYEFLPPTFGGDLLVTTREQATSTRAHRIEVEIMPEDVGALFLLRRAKLLGLSQRLADARGDDEALGRAITKELGGLPLALDQAGAYIEETRCNLIDYQQLYRTTRRALLLSRRGGHATDHPEPVAATWSLSFKKVEQTSPAAADLLRLCAFLHPDAIPEEIITKAATSLGSFQNTRKRSAGLLSALVFFLLKRWDTLSSKRNIFVLDDAIALLAKYALVARDVDEKTLSIHRLVQIVLKDAMNEQVRHQWAGRAVKAVNEAFPDVKFAIWSQCERCLPHALVCVAWIEQEQMIIPQATRLLSVTGSYLCERARYAEAEPLYMRALKIREEELGPTHPDTAISLNNLASLYRAQGRYGEAGPLYERALSIYERQSGPTHPDTAEVLNNLASLYNNQSRYAEAEPLYMRALKIREEELGPTHPNTAESLNNLATLYYAQGKYREAEPLYERALSIYERQLGPIHPHTAESLNNLAGLYRAQGRYGEAEPLLVRALSVYEEQLGSTHPNTAKSLNNLATLYYAQGKYREAEPLYERALSIYERQLGPIHPHTAEVLNSLAAFYYAQDKYREAEPLYERALLIYERQLGTEHPDTAQSLNNLANLYVSQGRYENAEPLYKRVLEIREQQLGTEHPDTAQSLNNLATLYIKQSKYAQAEALFQRALYILVRVLGPDHPDVIHARNNLTSLRTKQSQKLEAWRFFENAGFSFIDIDEPLSFLCLPATPLRQKKMKHKVYVRILASKPLDGNDILRIHDSALEVSKDIRVAFALVDKPVEDHVWLQIAALRANDFSVIPIPLTLLLKNQTAGNGMSAGVFFDKHIERFLGRGADPYNISHPVFDVLNFFGREALASDLMEQMNTGQPLGLFGLRKIGKSSLMRYIQRLMPCPTAYLDLQAGVEPLGIFERLLHAWDNDAAARFKIDLGLLDTGLSTEDPTTEFVKITLGTLDRMKRQNLEARLAIFLDEIELMVPPLDVTGTTLEQYLSLMHALRGLVQEDGRLSLMVAGVDAMINRISRWGQEQKQNPFFKFLQELYVPPLFELDCIQMIRNIGTQVQLSYSEEAATYVAQMSGGHPSLARQLCSLIYTQRRQQPGEVTQLSVERAVERFLFDPKYASSIDTSGLWGEVTNSKLWGEQAAKANQDVLFTLARSASPVAESVITDGSNEEALRSALFALHELSVIHPIEDSLNGSEPYYVIAFGLFHAWIRRVRLGLKG